MHDRFGPALLHGHLLQFNRLQLDYTFGPNLWDRRRVEGEPLMIKGHAAAVLWDVGTWRSDHATTRFRAGVAHRMSTSTGRPRGGGFTLTVGWTFNVGLVVDFPRARRAFLRTGVRDPYPEPHLGVGFPF